MSRISGQNGHMHAGLIAALDVGASKTACLIADVNRACTPFKIHPRGFAYVQSHGIRGGAVIEAEAVARSIAAAVERAEAMAKVQVRRVVLTVSGEQLASHRVSAKVSLGARPVQNYDLERCIRLSLSQSRIAGRRIIHVLPISWSVDRQATGSDPRGLHGRELGLELLIISIAETGFSTFNHCVEMAHLSLDQIVAAPLASGLAVLSQEERDMKAICIDMGGSSTSVAVFSEGRLLHVDSLAVGGMHVTHDIAALLSTHFHGAERIKTLHGSAIASSHEDRETIEAPPRGNDAAANPVLVPRSLLTGIIAPRIEESLELIKNRLIQAGFKPDLKTHIVLTGGGSQILGAREVAVRLFDCPVRLGRPNAVPELADSASGSGFSALIGAVEKVVFGPMEAVSDRSLSTKSEDLAANSFPGDVLNRAVGWLKANF